MSDQREDRLRGFCFFFQAEDGIRDSSVTGVQTCALPICFPRTNFARSREVCPRETERTCRELFLFLLGIPAQQLSRGAGKLPCNFRSRWKLEIGRASCRERV